jgi:hypothetical protein
MLKTPDIPATNEEPPVMRFLLARPDWMNHPPVSAGD